MMTSKDLEIVAKLACAYLNDVDAEEDGWVGGRDECSDAFERVMVEVHRLERLTNEAGDNEHNFELAYEHRVRDYNLPQDGWDSLNDIAIVNDIAIKEANKAMNKTNRDC